MSFLGAKLYPLPLLIPLELALGKLAAAKASASRFPSRGYVTTIIAIYMFVGPLCISDLGAYPSSVLTRASCLSDLTTLWLLRIGFSGLLTRNHWTDCRLQEPVLRRLSTPGWGNRRRFI